MKDFHYLIQNFFTHKDYLAPAEQIPGTIFTPLSFAFEAVVLLMIFTGAYWVSRKQERIKPTFRTLWFVLLVWEVVIILWENFSGETKGMDWATSLSLYPCSIFLYTLPFMIWGHGVARRIAYGYISTLGLLGALVNFLFPLSRLTTYSCISFPGFHTFAFHGSMLFVFCVVMMSRSHSYCHVEHWWELFLPCVASLIVSIPANLLNYSPIDADYMYFTGDFPLLTAIFAGVPEIAITAILYVLYILVPATFYLPSYLCHLVRQHAAASAE